MRAADPPGNRWIVLVRTVLALLVAVALAVACKPSRSPREVAGKPLTGTWTARSGAVGEPRDTGEVSWRITLTERDAGRLEGQGVLRMRAGASEFELSGTRGKEEVTLQFAFGGERVQYHGSLAGATTLVGELLMPRDTLPVTFTKE